MLCACRQQGGEVLATEVQQEDGPFFCPACQEPVMLKKGLVKMSHFAHWPQTNCAYAGLGESEEHRRAKLEIYYALVNAPGVSKAKVERYLQEVRPDVSFDYQGNAVAVEIQISTLSPAEIERRTVAYARKNIAVLWTSPLPLAIFESRYAPRDWERYLHRLYYGKLYYWSQELRLQPVTFEPYLLAPSWYREEKRSKRFVTPVLRHDEPSILDLVAVWRKPWRSLPRAKLWSEPRACVDE